MGCYMLSFFSTFLTIPFADKNPNNPFILFSFAIPFAVFGSIFICGGLFIFYGVIAAVFALQGKNFRYLIIGNIVANFLKHE